MRDKISVYAPNLINRGDRRSSLEAQFSGKEEFDLTIVTPFKCKNGEWSLWQTFYGIVEQEAAKKSEYFIFCEDDHVFTPNYSFGKLVDAIRQANAIGADILSGGMSWLRTPVQVSDCLFHVECFNGFQFTVVFSRFYETILSHYTNDGYVTDKFISEISEKIFVMYPYISIQADFGYSDVTRQNNVAGRVPRMFRNMQNWLHKLNKARTVYREALVPQNVLLCDLSDVEIPTYVIHMQERSERKEHIMRQFAGRKEFDVRFVDACTHTRGATGLWNSICKIVREAEKGNEDIILICEDDHTFTQEYDAQHFLRQVLIAGTLGTQILYGGVGGFGSMLPVCDGMYWTDWNWCTQFTIVYRKAYQTILNAEFGANDVADEFLSRLLPYTLFIYPFISEQTDFGYSDVTPSNNRRGRITEHFRNANASAAKYYATTLKYGCGNRMLFNRCGEEFREYFSSDGIKALQIGCGSNLLAGWLNTDINPVNGAMYLNAALKFPFSDGCLDYIFSEHQVEHLSYDDGKTMLEECFRTLKNRGILRITMPSLEFLARLYANPDNPLHQHYAAWSLQHYAPVMYADFSANSQPLPMALVVNNFMRMWGHRMLYDYNTFVRILQRIGFVNICRQESGMSGHAFLCDLEHHGIVIPKWANKLESMTIEATKP